jgi:wyosine [tRNA(Phe)-imidazoG37] synthetase (radical SAM superfamily)
MEEFLPLQKGIVYGPVLSRRLGRSLGINILSPYRKICSFDCSYCQYGSTTMLTMQPPGEAFPTSHEILQEVEKALVIHKYLDHLTFSGNGEPTFHPDFDVIAEGVRGLRDHFRPEVRIALFTNSTNLENLDVQKGIEYIDFPIFKLDAGDQEMVDKIDHPSGGIRIEHIIDQLAKLKGITIQSLFVAGEMEDPGNLHFKAWLHAIQKIKPKTVQLYSCDWSIPSRGVEKLPQYKLSRIADSVRDKCSCTVEIY